MAGASGGVPFFLGLVDCSFLYRRLGIAPGHNPPPFTTRGVRNKRRVKLILENPALFIKRMSESDVEELMWSLAAWSKNNPFSPAVEHVSPLGEEIE